MFMLKDPKKTAAMIIAIHKKPEDETSEPEDEAHLDEAKHLLEAIKANDPEGLMHSLKDFVALCMDEYEKAEDAAEGEESEGPEVA